MVPAAMPAVIDELTPAKSRASAKTIDAAGPAMGTSVDAAWERSSTWMPAEKNVAAAMMIMAELMAQPMPIESSVSTNSPSSCSSMALSPWSWTPRLWMISECRKRLWGITTAPSTLVTTTRDPEGRSNVTQDWAATGQSTLTMRISMRNDTPMSETNPMIHRSILRYEFESSMKTESALTATAPMRTGIEKSIWSAMAAPSISATTVATQARRAVERRMRLTGLGSQAVAASERQSPEAMPRCAALCCRTMSMTVESVTIQSRE